MLRLLSTDLKPRAEATTASSHTAPSWDGRVLGVDAFLNNPALHFATPKL